MIHDLDLAVALAGGQAATDVQGDSVTTQGPFHDRAWAEIAFAGGPDGPGMTARFEADRDAPERHRTMRITYPSGVLEIDFLARTFQNGTGFALNADFDQTEGGRDPLGVSVAAFVAACRGEAPRPLVTGEEAAAALALALRIEKAAA
jgi:predicted dehydrogenase